VTPRVIVILGTRPEVVKLAPVVRALRADPGLEVLVCATAQHRDMLDLALDVFGLRPDIDLDLMQHNQQLHEVTTRVLQAVTRTLREIGPQCVLVQGDTTTAMAAAMAAFYEGVPVGHVEAGLRTGDLTNPFPEEMNRRVIGTVATLHFAPTPRARAALLAEGVRDDRVIMTGNTVIDALAMVSEETGRRPAGRSRILVTAHRRESFGRPLESICAGLRRLAVRNPALEIVYPVHRNPQIQEPVFRLLADLPNVHLIEPLGYTDFVAAMRRADIILTDSGGVQEEAPSLGKPVLVMRETTERPEAVEAGAALLVGTDADRIVLECERLLTDDAHYAVMSTVQNPFGDGHASTRIVAALRHWFELDSSTEHASGHESTNYNQP
jgi:UDP-N-acetylglucosamine 2-epimerase (non-hydrolysing)